MVPVSSDYIPKVRNESECTFVIYCYIETIPKHRSLKQWQSFSCSQFHHLVRIQWGQFVSTPYYVSWGSSTEAGWPTSKMAHSQGWQVSAGCELGSQLGLLVRAPVLLYLGLSTWLLGLSHNMAAGLQDQIFQENKPQYQSSSQIFPCFTLANTPLAKDSSTTKSRVNVQGSFIRV